MYKTTRGYSKIPKVTLFKQFFVISRNERGNDALNSPATNRASHGCWKTFNAVGAQANMTAVQEHNFARLGQADHTFGL